MVERLLRSQVRHVFLFGFTSASFAVTVFNYFAQNVGFGSVALIALVWLVTLTGSVTTYRTLHKSVVSSLEGKDYV